MSLRELRDKIENITEEQQLNIEIGVTKGIIERLEKYMNAVNGEQQRLPSPMRTIGLLNHEYQEWCYYTKRLESLLAKKDALTVDKKQ